jgi:chorismate mutase / prephenate dehydratase
MRPDSSDQTRRDIQSVDRDIHDLLMRRAKLVDTAKGEAAASSAPIRPAQAARILRAILARHTGRFPVRALVQIWSDTLFAADMQTTLHVFAGEDAAGFRDLARVCFGCMLPITSHGSATAVVHACADDPLAIGLVPPPESVENGQAWWEQLAPAGHSGPRIAQSLPFIRNDASPAPLPQGYAIGTIEQESTGRDTSILRLECQAEMSRAKLQSHLRQAGFEAQILAASRESSKSAASLLLVASKGFVAPDDERLETIANLAGDALERVALVGGYADPFDAASPS